MDVFLTGATGYIGSVILEKLQERGHRVTALARSETAAQRLQERGARVRRGGLEDIDPLTGAAREAEGIIHAALARGADTGPIDRGAVEAMLAALAGSGRPFVYTSGTAVMGSTGERVAGEWFALNPPEFLKWRPEVERLVLAASERKVRGIVIRPVTVYGRGGGILGRWQRGELPMVGNGENRLTWVHVDDLAELYVLALEGAPAGQLYLGAEGPALEVRQVCAAAGVTARVSLEQARQQFGHFAEFLVLDQKIFSTKASRELRWFPSRPGVLENIRSG